MGSRKNTGSSHAVAPPDTRHSASTASTSIPVEAQPAQRGTGRVITRASHAVAASA